MIESLVEKAKKFYDEGYVEKGKACLELIRLMNLMASPTMEVLIESLKNDEVEKGSYMHGIVLELMECRKILA